MREEAITGLESSLDEILKDLQQRSQEPDRRAEYERRQREHRESQVSCLMEQADIPAGYLSKTFDNFEMTSANRMALEACKAYATLWASGRQTSGMALFGNIGVGKSHLAVAVLKQIIKEHLVGGVYANVLLTFEMIRWSFQTGMENPLKKILRSPFLVLDDMGSERPTVWTLEQISMIMEYRLSSDLPILVTSNALDWSGLKRMLTLKIRGDVEARAHLEPTVNRIIDRLHDSVGNPVIIRGKSWRGRKPKAR